MKNVSSDYYPTLGDFVLRDSSKYIRAIILVLVGTIILYASSKFKISALAVPFTMQTFAVLLIGAVYGWKLGMLTVLIYLLEGAAGLPVFAETPEKGIGLLYMTGPTGGYLVGFVLAAGVTGYLAQRGWDRSFFLIGIAMLLGNLAIYIPGLAWLTILFSFESAIKFGLLPFIGGDLSKIILAIICLPSCWKLFNMIKRS